MSKKLVLWENFNIRMILKELLKLKKITSIWSVTVSGIPLSGSRFFKEWEAYAMQSLLNWRTHQDESWAAPLSFCWRAFEMGGEFAFLTLSQGTLMVLVWGLVWGPQAGEIRVSQAEEIWFHWSWTPEHVRSWASFLNVLAWVFSPVKQGGGLDSL